jgi:hypothetical protein
VSPTGKSARTLRRYNKRVKVVYALSFEDYQFLQPPFRLQAGKNPGVRIMLGVCVIFAAFGLLVATQGLGLVHAFPGVESGEFSVGSLIIALSVSGALAGYFLDKRPVRRALEKYGANIRTGYSRVHCPDQRTFEADVDWHQTGHTHRSQVGIQLARQRH